MQFKIKDLQPQQDDAHCLMIGIYEEGKLTPAAEQINTITHGKISTLIKQGDMTGKTDELLLLHDLPNITAKRVLLIGLGKQEKLTETVFRQALLNAFRWIKAKDYEEVSCYLADAMVKKRDTHWLVSEILLRCHDAFYQFNQFKTKKDTLKLDRIHIVITATQDITLATEAMHQAKAVASGIKLTKDLGNLPANVCTPTYLANQAKDLAKNYSHLKCKIFDEKYFKKMGLEGFLAVAQGSVEPAKLILLEYRGGPKTQKPIALVGKGITFDSGGICLKPSPAMDEMKYDMCGAASVLGTLKAIAELDAPINIIGVIASAENMPSGQATKPGDIVKTHSGQTVEILNTDAEGRLVLCDALSYVAYHYSPEAIVDVATLTGAIIISLGFLTTGLFSNNAELSKALEQAADQSFDRLWPMPLWDEYAENLKSNFADMANISTDRAAGSIMAACYLNKFVDNIPWAHLDIAGTAWVSGKEKGATGRPVALLVQYLLNTISQ